jgi:hypothetical protein
VATIPRDGRHPFSPISQVLPWPDPYFLSSSLLFPIPPPYGPSNSYEIFPSLPVPYRAHSASVSSLVAALTKNRGAVSVYSLLVPPLRPRSLPTTHLKFFLFNLLRTPLHSQKTQLFCFQAIPHSLRKTAGGGVPHRFPARGCRERFIFMSPVTSHESPVSLLSKPLPVRRACIERTIGTGGRLHQNFFRPQLRRLRLRGGCDG